MLIEFVLCKKINHRNIELHHTTRGENIGVLQRNGDYQHFPWLGFISAAEAKAIKGAQPVKLKASRVGTIGDIHIQWRDMKPNEYVQGCLVRGGVYAVVKDSVRII